MVELVLDEWLERVYSVFKCEIQVVRNPFQLVSFIDYEIYKPQPPIPKPCGEIQLTEWGWCRLGFRDVSSPFELESFTERYLVV
jgi:hypothetical protein